MADEREVKARLTVEQTGDAAAFSETAGQVDALAGAAAGAEPSLASLTEQLKNVVDASDVSPAAEAFREFASALEELAGVQSIDEQRESLEKAIAAFKRFGEEAPEALGESEKAAKQYQEVLEQLEARHRTLADPLTASARDASQALATLQQGIEKNAGGSERLLVTLKRRIEDYAAALRKAKADGQNISGEQVAELQRLQTEYESARVSIAKYAAAKKDVRAEINSTNAALGNEVRNINDLGDVVQVASPKLANLVGIALGVVGAFTAGWEAGTKLREVLNRFTDGGFDRAVQKLAGLTAIAERLAGGADDAADRLQVLANQKNIFENLGIEGFSDDIERNEQLLAQHKSAIEGDAQALDRFAESIGLSREKLDEQAKALAENIARFAAANSQLTAPDLAGIFRPRIQELLDQFARLGVQVPQELQKLADSWGILTSAAEGAAIKHKAAVDKIVADVTGAAAVSRQQLEAQAAAIGDAFSKINVQQLDTAALDRANKLVAKLVEGFRTAGVAIPASLIKAADQVGVFVAAMERAGGGVGVFTSASTDLSEAAVRLTGSVDGARRSIESVPPAATAAGEAVATAGQRAQEGGAGFAAAAVPTLDLSHLYGGVHSAAGAAGDAVAESGQQAAGAAPGIQAAATATEGLGPAAETAGAGINNMVRFTAEFVTIMGQFLRGVAGIGQALVGIATGSAGFSRPIITELRAIVTEAQAAKAALDQVRGA